MLKKAIITVALVWAIFVSLTLVVMLQNQAHNEQSDAFRGRYINMAIEGMDVLVKELSRANIRISILEQAKEKTELPDPSTFPIRPKGT